MGISLSHKHMVSLVREGLSLSKASSAPLISYPHQHKLSLVLLILVILTGLRWSFRDLNYICLMAKDVKDARFSQPFEFPLLRTMVRLVVHFKNWVVCSLVIQGFLYFWGISPLSDM